MVFGGVLGGLGRLLGHLGGLLEGLGGVLERLEAVLGRRVAFGVKTESTRTRDWRPLGAQEGPR